MVLPTFKVGLHFIVSASFDLSKIHSEMCLTDDFKPSQAESGEWLTESSSVRCGQTQPGQQVSPTTLQKQCACAFL